MAGPAGRSPEEEALLQKAMVIPQGVLGEGHAPQELAFVVRETHVLLVHTEAEVARAPAVVGEALAAVAGTSP